MIFFAAGVNAFGQTPADKQVVRDTTKWRGVLFPFGQWEVVENFSDNAQRLSELRDIMSDRDFTDGIDSIVVSAASSPDGNPAYNKLLAKRRANSLKDFIVGKYPYIDRSIVSINTDQGYWDGLIGQVELDPEVPARDEFLKMLRDPDLSDEAKNQKMSTMQNGQVLAYLRSSYIMLYLRRGAGDIIFYSSAQYSPEPQPDPELTLQQVPEPTPQPLPEAEPAHVVEAASAPQRDVVLALRTNLLLDVIGGPNIGIEVPIGKHFSAAADFIYAYTRINNRFALQTIQGSLEGRYWFRQRDNKPLIGWNLGVYGVYGGRYDIQWQGGWQGDSFWSAGITGGYSLPIHKCLNLDFSLGIGYLFTPEARHYTRPRDGYLVWEQTRYNMGRFSLTKARVDLVWLIGTRK